MHSARGRPSEQKVIKANGGEGEWDRQTEW